MHLSDVTQQDCGVPLFTGNKTNLSASFCKSENRRVACYFMIASSIDHMETMIAVEEAARGGKHFISVGARRVVCINSIFST